MELVIEIRNKGSFPRYQRFNQPLIQIGRGFGNDIILADPYVCASHICLEVSAGEWTIRDLGEKNPVVYRRDKRPANKQIVHYGDEFLVGKTLIRILSTDSPVEPVRAISELGNMLRVFTSIPGVLLLFFGLLGLVVWQNYNSNAFEFSFEKSLGRNVFLLLGPIVWAGIWAILGRVLHHEGRFAAHATVSLLALAGFFIGDELAQYLGYLLSSKLVFDVIGFSLTGLLIAWLISKNLAYATELSNRMRLLTAYLFALSFVGLVVLINFSSDNSYSLKPSYISSLKPPSFNITRGVPQSQFLEEVDGIFQHELEPQ